MDELHIKKTKLEQLLAGLGSVAVAFSAGVDSTFLLKTAHEVLRDGAVAVTVTSAVFPEREQRAAEAFCAAEGIRLIETPLDVFDVDGFCANPENRCYLCKKEICGKLKNAAAQMGIEHMIEGSNADDTGDYRPGMRALRECGVRSPMIEAGLTKNDIRALSAEYGLQTWDKLSLACLATRIPYGEKITPEKLCRIDRAEQKLAELGFCQYRVRSHGDTARIELPPEEIGRCAQNTLRDTVTAYFHRIGFRYVSLDLDGYRTGSMNEGKRGEGKV